MNIGFVSTWFERGAAYVTKQYLELLKDNFEVFVYARGGEHYGKNQSEWDLPYVTWSPKLLGSNINFNHIQRWIKKNNIDILFFNEQREVDVVYKIIKKFPEIKVGTYIDYYKENTVKEFNLYDFLICNTKRHYSVFKKHPQCYYVPWGTDVDLFNKQKESLEELVFFHSAGMSLRKGTELVIEAFIEGKIYTEAKLIIHIQGNIQERFGYTIDELNNYNIDVIEKTVTAPGLYHKGDIYVYPTKLDGLGLTIYEALSSGMAVITTDHPPMNEVINEYVGCLVDVELLRSRSDGYYWPLSIVNKKSLIESMKFMVDNPTKVDEMKKRARKVAEEKWNWKDRKSEVVDIFTNTKVIVRNPDKELLNNQPLLEKIKRKIGSSYLYSFINKFL